MKKTIVTLAVTAASLTFSAGAYALCVEIDNYFPHDPNWMGTALRTLSSSTHAALRAVHTAGGTAARFSSDDATAVDTVSTFAGYTGLRATAEAPISSGDAVRAVGNTSAPVVKLIGSDGALLDGVANGSRVFEVDADGVTSVRGRRVAPKGPRGPEGPDGAPGSNGAAGQPGAATAAENFPACVRQNCANVCTHGTVQYNEAPCSITGNTGGTTRGRDVLHAPSGGARICSSSAVMRARAFSTDASLTWPNPRIISGSLAISMARSRLPEEA